MYKKWFITFILLALGPLYVHAQIFENIHVQFNSGAAVPLEANHFEKYWNTGIHFGGGLESSINEMFAVKWDLAFNSFVFNHEDWRKDFAGLLRELGEEEENIADIVVNGANRYLLESSLSAKFYPVRSQHINPFLEVGAGIVNMSTDDLIVNVSGPEFTTETVPYYTIGLGTEFSYWQGFKLFGDILYKYMYTKDENNIDFPMDFKEPFRKQETSLVTVNFGIIFDLTE